MENLIMEHSTTPVYLQSLYKWTPQPTVLKHDCDWDAPITEDLECSYCREIDSDNIIDSDDRGYNFVYVHPEGYLYLIAETGIAQTKIQFCPMCGRRF